MKNQSFLFRLVVLVAAMMCALGAVAAEAYACYTSSNTTLTFYYDNYRSSRTGTTYDLNTGSNDAGWDTDGTKTDVTNVVFDPSFAGFFPTSTFDWFYLMGNLLSIKGIEYLNTSEVTNMGHMFNGCSKLRILDVSHFNTAKVTDMRNMFRDCSALFSLDLSSFNTSKVTNMYGMFNGCSNLRTIYVDNGWSTAAVTNSTYMFAYCTSLVGGQGTTYDYSHTDKTYAHIDGGTSNPGYFTDINTTMPYACYTPSNTTLTFYYDNQRGSRLGRTYDLNTENNFPGWRLDFNMQFVTKVVFDPSFAGARPTTTFYWFYLMINLESITGLNYLNTSEVTNMGSMFAYCPKLASLDVSHFNTSKVTDMCNMFNECSSLTSLDVSGFNTSEVTDMKDMFIRCSGLTSLDVSHFNTSKVTDMSYMFSECSGLTSLDLSHFNTSEVTSMESMFMACSSLRSLDLSGFNTSKVTDMGYVFDDCYNLRTIYVGHGWSTAALTRSINMFRSCYDLVGGQGTTYDASHVDAAYAHIDGGTSNPGYFTVGTEAYACYTPSNTTLTFYYDNQRIIRTGRIYDLNTENNDTGWDTDGTKTDVTRVVFDPSFAGARPTTTYDWFYSMEKLSFIEGIDNLNTSNVTNMAHMFNGCSRLNFLDVSHFNTSKVTNMRSMFRNCSGLTNLDLSSFNTSKVTDMYSMFYGCSSLRTIYAGSRWSTAAVTSSSMMFFNCTSLVGGKGTTYSFSNPADKTYAHIDGGTSNPGYFTAGTEAYACYTSSNTTLTFYYDNYRSSRSGTTYDLNTGANDPGWKTDGTYENVTKVVFDPSFAAFRPTTTRSWFSRMQNLQSITGMKEYLNTSEVTNMAYMFWYCLGLTSLDLSRFDTSKVTDMYAMFSSCIDITSLDLSSFNTTKVTNMSYMFYPCRNLQTIYVGSGWSTAAVTYSSSMFFNCTSLVGGQGTTYDANHVDAAYAHIDGGTSNPGYFTAKNAGQRGDVDGSGNVNISDVTALIDLLLGGGTISNPAADCNQDGSVNISDVTALIDYLLSGSW